MMLRRFLLLVLLLPLGAFAQCGARSPEPFAVFLEKFSRDKAFSVARTMYPLELRRVVQADNEIGMESVSTRISRAEDESEPTMSDYARTNGLQLNMSSLAATTATARIEKPDTDWVLDYDFVRKGRCWYLKRIEDHTL